MICPLPSISARSGWLVRRQSRDADNSVSFVKLQAGDVNDFGSANVQ